MGRKASVPWNRVVEATYRGDGWWHIVFDCGHAMKALHGSTSPLGEEAACFHCQQVREAARDDRRKNLEAL
jgi:hypothetical protein